MTTPRQHLEESIKRLEAKHGPDNPLVKDFKQQLEGMKAAGEQTTQQLFTGRPLER